MFLTRGAKSTDSGSKSNKFVAGTTRDDNALGNLDEFLKKRDFTGAITLLEYERRAGDQTRSDSDLWIAYCYFHLGEYDQTLKIYERLSNSLQKTSDKKKHSSALEEKTQLNTFLAVCRFFLGEYPESERLLKQSSTTTTNTQLFGLQRRLRLHLAHRLAQEEQLLEEHKNLQDVLADQLSLASIHYLRAHHQEAIDIYKKCLLEKRKLGALSVYLAFCYYKLDYYDVSQEVLSSYLSQCENDSLVAVNLRACNHYRLYNGRAAESELRQLIDSCSPAFSYGKELIRHNLVVFRNGELALQVLPPLLDFIPEARLNLVIYYLRQRNLRNAFQLLENLQPSIPQEYILKAVVNAAYGQHLITTNQLASTECLKLAQQYFQLVGSSASECDTIPGRQCMASFYFLTRQFDDVLLYLSSIKSYFYNDDVFNFNYGQAKCTQNNFKEAEEAFLLIKDETIVQDSIYVCWLIRCYIMNKNAKAAWDLWEQHQENPNESFNYLVLIANDCYKMGAFYYSAKAFQLLEKLDSNVEYAEGKRGACCGMFQMIIAGKEDRHRLSEVIALLRTTQNQVNEQIVKVIRSWEMESRL